MQLQQLEYFIKVVECGSLNKAAELFYVTQPALSKAIVNLERDVGTELLYRTNKGVALTENGKKIYRYAKTIMDQVDLINKVTLGETSQSLTVASYPLISMSRVVAEFYNLHQGEDIVVNLIEKRLQNVISEVDADNAELGFLLVNNSQLREVKNTLKYKDMEMNVLGVDTWYANVGEKNPLYYKDLVTMQELTEYPVVRLYDDHFSNLTYYMRIDGVLLAETNKPLYVSDNAGLVNVMRHTQAYRYAPGLGRKDFADFGIRTIPIQNCNVEVVVCWIKKRKTRLSPLAEDFVRFLQNWVEEEL